MKRLLIILAVVFATLSATAENPIKWRMTVNMSSATEGTVTIRAVVEHGWHLYGTALPEGGPKPTSFSFAGSEGVKFTSDLKPATPAAKHRDEMFGLDLYWWDTNVTFTRTFKLIKAEGAKISATVSFMGCNNVTCLPPSSASLTYNFKK